MTNKTISQQLEELAGQMCDKYCKYRDEYLKRYADPDIANEMMLEEQCKNCPLTLMLQEVACER